MQKFTINDLNYELADAMRMLKNKEIDIDTAKTIAILGQTMINASKVEAEFVRAVGGFVTNFLPEAEDNWKEERDEPRMLSGGEKIRTPDSAYSFDGIRASPTEQLIVDHLIENGGESRVGSLVARDRSATMKALERLENKGVVTCIERAKTLGFTPGKHSHTPEDALYCGTWKLAKTPDTSHKLIQNKRKV